MLKEFGKDLKRLREFKGVSLAEISAQTRINPKFLITLEDGVFDFQPETYIRSFIKAYAKALDEDENRILNEYDKAKAGFYTKRKFITSEGKEFIPREEKINISVAGQTKVPAAERTEESSAEPVYSRSIQEDQPDYFKPKEDLSEQEFSNRTWPRKVLLIVLLLAIATGVYFLIDYLYNSGEKKNETKPKTFNEISNEYENKITGRKDSLRKADSLKAITTDSLKLMVKALKDIKIKVYVDENKLVEEDISAKDSILVTAKDQFRFSSTGNQTVELYLNGKYLRKPATLSGTSIKNLIIKKDGIISE